MATIVTRSGKGSPLTHLELDANFDNLNADKAGYGPGDGGSVVQLNNKSASVTLNKRCGEISLNSETLAADTTVSFTLINNTISATDIIVLNHASIVGTLGNYVLSARADIGSAIIAVRNITAAPLTDAILIRFAVIKASAT